MNQQSGSGKLNLFDSVGMAVGGMVGGGIFAVLGVAVNQSGNGAFMSFGLAGLLALITGVSYARLTCSFDEPGGSFTFVEHMVGPATAGTLSWFLILGYTFTISLYAYTFGEYLARLTAPGIPWLHPLLGGGAILGLTALNLVGVRESGLAEDLLVYGKVIILGLLVVTGLFFVEPSRALPVLNRGGTAVVGTAAMIFVGYEGFQLLTYDYEDIRDHHRTLPRAMIYSILGVTLLYVLIAFVTTGTVAPAVVEAHKETVLAEVARPVFGRVGFTVVVVAAVTSTASAINATIFATARLGRRVAEEDQLPGVLVKYTRGGVPVVFTLVLSLLALVIQYIGSLHQITEFSSLVFLFVFGVVNLAALWHGEYSDWTAPIPLIGGLGCWIAVTMLIHSFYRHQPNVLWMTVGITSVLLVLRLLFVLPRKVS